MSRDRFQRPDWYEDEDDLDRPAPPRPAPGKATLTSRIGQPNIQRKAASPGKVSLTAGLPRPAGLAIGRAAQSPGWPLPCDLRGRLEGAVGQDLGSVRVHTGAESAAAAEAVQAKAYTTGADIHFAAGRYDPDGEEGQRLIAHEVAHTLQQSGAASAPQAKPNVSSPADSAEVEADVFAEAFVSGAPPRPIESPGSASPVIARDADEEATSALREGQTNLARTAIVGPLRSGQRKRSGDLEVDQTDDHSTYIALGDAYISISGRPNNPREAYSFYVEPQRIPTQRVVRVTATDGIGIEHNAGDPPQLICHIRRAADASVVMSDAGQSPLALVGLAGGADIDAEGALPPSAIQETCGSDQAQISLDGSHIDINVVEPDGRFAYWIDPEWTGSGERERVVYIVATPGVRVTETAFEGEQPLAVGTYQRKLVAQTIRVQDPARVPRQGTAIDPAAFTGTELFPGTDVFDPFGGLKAHTGRAGVTVELEQVGARLSISAADPTIGAHFAYQIVPKGDGTAIDVNRGADIYVVIGPGTIVSVVEPVPVAGRGIPFFPAPMEAQAGDSLREAGVEFHIFEVDEPSLVPRQGSAIDPEHFGSVGRQRGPHQHEYVQSPLEGGATAIADTIMGSIPGLGDASDWSDLGTALFAGRDRWGQKTSGGDVAALAVAALLPLAGAGLLRGAARLSEGVATLAARFGKSADEMEAILDQVRGLSRSDRALVARVEAAMRAGDEIVPRDLAHLERAITNRGLTTDVGRSLHYPGSGRPPDSSFYSSAFEARLERGVDFPNVDEKRHFQQANRQLHEAFQSDPEFARQMEELYPGIVDGVRPSGSGTFPRRPPTPAVTWHHEASRDGVMQLVPVGHHQGRGPVQDTLHPEGRGGMENWGGGRKR